VEGCLSKVGGDLTAVRGMLETQVIATGLPPGQDRASILRPR
jgi:hypothetical protein